LLRIVVTLLIAAIGAAFGGVETSAGAPELESVSLACTQAQKRTRSKALAAYKKLMPKQRKAYFKRVHSAKKRKAFVKKQQAKLKRLRAAAGDQVAAPRPPGPRPPAPGPLPGLPANPPPPPPSASATPGADLAVAITDAIDPLTQWNRQRYTITVTNNGPLGASGVTLSDPLLPALRLLSVKSSRGSSTCGLGPELACNLGGFAPGESATVTIEARVRGAGSVVATATAGSSTADHSPSNNTATATTIVSGSPGLPAASAGPACSPTLAPDPTDVGLNEGPTDYNHSVRPIGAVRAVMLFVDFSDAPQTEPTDSLFQALAPAATRLNAMSQGRLSLSITPLQTWLRMPRTSGSYNLDAVGGTPAQRDYIADAVALADPAVDFRDYQYVHVVAAAGAAFSNNTIWWAKSGGPIAVDGTQVKLAVITAGSERADAPVLVHEIGHAFGLPDVYDPHVTYSDGIRYVGHWDPMSRARSHADFTAWHKWKLGWLDPAHLRCLTTSGTIEETLTPVEAAGGVKAVVLQTGPSTAYVVEARELPRIGGGVCDFGVLVYALDATVHNGSPSGMRVKTAHPQPDPAPEELEACGPLSAGALDLGPGEVPAYEDGVLRVEVLIASEAGYRVRVTRK
jgi:M6 family metalloprotease-like protein/uncharacterized repeat protein (TIGR01451 family)